MACVRRWRDSWVVDWRDPNTRKRTIEAQPDKDSAERRLADVIQSGKIVSNKRISFKERADEWLETTAKSQIKASTYQEYEAVLRNHVYPLIGSKPFAKVGRQSIKALIAKKKNEGCSQSTIRNILAPVRGVFFDAMDSGTAHSNPAARIGKLTKAAKDKPAGKENKKIVPLTREEAQALLAKAAKSKEAAHHYPLFLCALRTGIRQGELIALKVGDVDFDEKLILVQRNLSRGVISVTKNGKDRKVDMSDGLAKVLKEIISKRRADALRDEMKKSATDRLGEQAVLDIVNADWLFQTPAGTQIDPSNLRKLFDRLLAAEPKSRRIRFHDLRHTFASLLLQNGEGLTYVKEQMGHSSINVTVDIYGHLVPGGNRQAVNRLDDESAAV